MYAKTGDTRASFREALRDTQGYVPDGLARRPAFISSVARLARPRRRDLRALPKSAKATSPSGGVAAVARAMAEGSTSAVEQMSEALDVIRRRQAQLNAFAHLAPEDGLLAQAQVLDKERAEGKLRGPLHGVPISVKDVVHVAGMPTTSSSKVMEGYMPEEDATAVARLRQAGAIVMGKTQTHEFALVGVTTAQSRNPWDPTRDPGGSSGGSAISVATGMSLLSVGTDTRASIRVPAALCGIVGYKPTYGLVSTEGVVTLSWSMDHLGLQGRSIEDVALMLNVVQGLDSRDPATLDLPADDYADYLFRDVAGLRVGVPMPSLGDVAPEVLEPFRASVQALESLGVQVVELDTPSEEDFHLATSLGLIVSRCEAAASIALFPTPGPYTPPPSSSSWTRRPRSGRWTISTPSVFGGSSRSACGGKWTAWTRCSCPPRW